MKRVYLGNKELTTIATVTNGGGDGDDTKKLVDYFNKTLTKFTIPDGVTSIGFAAFNECSSLTSITIPNSVTRIVTWAFYGCSSLNSITIPKSVTSFDEGSFEGCSGLTTMTVEATTPPIYGSLPGSVQTIYVPASSVDVYKSAYGWKNYASKIQAIVKKETVVTYSDGTTKEFTINGNITDSSIENKNNATKVEIGAGVTSIDNSAFANCTSLTSVIIPNTVIVIDMSTFQGCSSLTGITIPTGITTIRKSAFENCTSLTSVTIPSTTTWIGQSIFNGCTSLSNIIYQGTMANWNYVKFHGSWHDGVPATVVTCSDGTVKL